MQQSLRRINSVLALLLASITFSGYADTDISMELYKEKKYEEAFKYFNELAGIGNAQAMYNIGIMYDKGEGVKQDLTKAYAWMSVANERLSKKEYIRTAKKIFGTLVESEQKAALDLATELNARFSKERIIDNLAPKPLSDEDCTQDVEPIKRANPKYPRLELIKGRMGIVEFETTISPQGYVRDVIITSGTTLGFIYEAIKVLPEWRHSPRIVNDKAVPAERRVLFSFEIELNSGDRITNAKGLKKELEKVKDKALSGDATSEFKYGLMLNHYRLFKSYLKDINLEHQESNKWFLSSAVSGISNAQYHLGRNMLQGLGCAVDEQTGTKWIRSAAIGGYSPAQRFLAVNLINDTNEEKYREAINFLKYSVELDNYYPTKLLLAWEYATSMLDDIRNGSDALNLLKSKPINYYDPVRIKETEAAAHAELGDYAEAVKVQNSALEEAQKFGWEIVEMRSRLKSYLENKPWRGEYYVSISPPPIIEGAESPIMLKDK